MIPDLQQRIDSALQDINCSITRSNRRWEAGELKRDELTHYAEQYRFFETMLPTFFNS